MSRFETPKELRKRLARETAKRRLHTLDAGLVRASLWRALRRRVLFVGSIVAFVLVLGVPHLRVRYVKHQGRPVSGLYWSVTGNRTLVAGQVAPSCPLIALVPLSLLREEK